MKKKIFALCLVIATCMLSFGGITAFAEVSLEECDLCFQTTVNSLLTEDEVGAGKVNALRKPLYDLNLLHMGYVYEFSISAGDGYAVIICDEGEYVAQEFVPNGVSPYAEVEDMCVYVNNMQYLACNNGILYDIKTGVEITEEMKNILAENAVFFKESGVVEGESVVVEVAYTSRTLDGYAMSQRPPAFYCAGLTGACAAQAGGNLIGYFDRYYEDLIPNHTAGFLSGSYYLYNGGDEYVNEAIKQLYADMNGKEEGITEAEFKTGMQKYCARKGLSCDFTSLMQSGKLNYTAVGTSMKAEKPVALFLSTYNIGQLYVSNNVETIYYTIYSGNHVMAGFGYRDITYILANGTSRNEKFIYVTTGFGDIRNAYFNINFNTNINSALSVYIH